MGWAGRCGEAKFAFPRRVSTPICRALENVASGMVGGGGKRPASAAAPVLFFKKARRKFASAFFGGSYAPVDRTIYRVTARIIKRESEFSRG